MAGMIWSGVSTGEPERSGQEGDRARSCLSFFFLFSSICMRDRLCLS